MRMDIQVYKLSRDMADKYISYFDDRAFSDGNPQKGCYCVWHYWTEKHEYERSLLPENERPFCKRDYAKELIQNGILNGFVAVHKGEIVGFCNADSKERYFRLSRENAPSSYIGVSDSDRILSVVCFTVAPDMRRRGIAKALLNRASKYAQDHGYDYIEGYPPLREFTVHDCGGSVSMYKSQGFEIIDIPGGIVARKRSKK